MLVVASAASPSHAADRTSPPGVGEVAPAVLLSDQHGRAFALGEVLKERDFVVIAFYPKAFTSGWGTEFSRFREDAAKFMALNAEVVGISADPPDRNLAWTRELRLPFRLLSDVDPAGQVGRRYGVWDDLWRIERRATFIVDRRGTVRWTESGSACVDTSRTLDALSKLARER